MTWLRSDPFCSLKNCKWKCMMLKVAGAVREKGPVPIQNIRLRFKGKKGEHPSPNCDNPTKNKPTAQWCQRALDSVGELKIVSLTRWQPLSMLRKAPGVTSAPLWAVEGPGNLSWCSCCQPWCFAAAVCHPGGWDLLKGNHVNLSVTTQSKAEGWSWQAWQSQHKVPRAEVTAFPQRCNVGHCFIFSFCFIFAFPFYFHEIG